MRKLLSITGFTLLSTLGLTLSLELISRCFLGSPQGYFVNMIPHEYSLYPPNQSIPRTWGKIPYLIETNNLGFRGSQSIDPQKAAHTIRIVTLGDSITDGFFVNNPDTYPVQLQVYLDNHSLLTTEVINAAKGGASIDKELAIYKKYVAPLNADIALLTFVTNDLNDLKSNDRNKLLNYFIKTDTGSITNWLLTRSTLAETALHNFLRWRFDDYATPDLKDINNPDRYHITDNQDYKNNALAEVALSEQWRNLVLSPEQEAAGRKKMQDYLFVLNTFNQELNASGTTLILVYYPAYSQIYLDSVSFWARDALQDFCEAHNIPFIDLSPAYKQADRNTALHLAPLDYHPNPSGNQLIATTIGEFLLENNFLPH